MTPTAWLTWWKLAGCPTYIPSDRMIDVPEEAFDAVLEHHGHGSGWRNYGFGCTVNGYEVVLYRSRGTYSVQCVGPRSGPSGIEHRSFESLKPAKYIMLYALKEGELP